MFKWSFFSRMEPWIVTFMKVPIRERSARMWNFAFRYARRGRKTEALRVSGSLAVVL